MLRFVERKKGAGIAQSRSYKIKNFVNICDYVSKELVSQSILHIIDSILNLKMQMRRDFTSISVMFPDLTLCKG